MVRFAHLWIHVKIHVRMVVLELQLAVRHVTVLIRVNISSVLMMKDVLALGLRLLVNQVSLN